MFIVIILIISAIVASLFLMYQNLENQVAQYGKLTLHSVCKVWKICHIQVTQLITANGQQACYVVQTAKQGRLPKITLSLKVIFR